jgi:hypothetical protein
MALVRKSRTVATSDRAPSSELKVLSTCPFLICPQCTKKPRSLGAFLFRYDERFFGTFLPFLRALESPIAIACLRLFTLPP